MWTKDARLKIFNAKPRSPSSCIDGTPPDFLSKRITIFSPCTVGRVETRRSTSWSPIRKLNRPSWGIRFSSIFKSESIFIRDVTASWSACGSAESLLKYTVYTIANPGITGHRFYVNVWRACTHSLFENSRDNLRYRRFTDHLSEVTCFIRLYTRSLILFQRSETSSPRFCYIFSSIEERISSLTPM